VVGRALRASGIKATADRGTSTDILTDACLQVPNSLSLDMGVDTHEFRPWPYDEIAGVMRRRPQGRQSGLRFQPNRNW